MHNNTPIRSMSDMGGVLGVTNGVEEGDCLLRCSILSIGGVLLYGDWVSSANGGVSCGAIDAPIFKQYD